MRNFKSFLKEKTLTPAEKKKREEIAQAMERDNPDMPMAKKMAIATATAKRVVEGAYLKGSIESRADAHEDQADHHNSQAEKAHKAGDKMAASAHKAAARAHMKAASYFDKHLSKPAHLRPQAAGGATSQAAHAATQKANQYNESTQIDEILDTPQAMQSYKDKNKRSKEKAANSAAAKIFRGPDKDGKRADHSPELKTMAKRRSGEKMVDRLARRKTLKLLRKGK